MLRTFFLALLFSTPSLAQSTLLVGDHERYTRVEAALADAHPGDTILVEPRAGNRAYERTALLIRTPRITIRAKLPAAPTATVTAAAHLVPLSGEGFDYTGEGSVPRAIVQVDPAGEGFTLEGFELSGARNTSFNGAGVRINQADHVTVRACSIHDNDMGVMSGGTLTSALDQRIELCDIFRNGSIHEEGQSHNLYLGGASVVLSACTVHHSTVGHNVKSRAHATRLEYCWIHDAHDREVDLVDAKTVTDAPASDAVIVGCVIVKDPACAGNHNVIHFGQDVGHDRTGTLYLVGDTIVTPFPTAVVMLSAPGASVTMADTLLCDGGANARGQVFAALAEKAGPLPLARRVRGSANAWSAGFNVPAALGTPLGVAIGFVGPETGDFRVRGPAAARLAGLGGRPLAELALPAIPGRAGDGGGAPYMEWIPGEPLRARKDGERPGLGARAGGGA